MLKKYKLSVLVHAAFCQKKFEGGLPLQSKCSSHLRCHQAEA